MTTLRVRWRRIGARLVGLAGLRGIGEGVVDFEDDAFGAVEHQKSSLSNRLSLFRESRTGSSIQRLPCRMSFGGGVVVVMRY